MLGRLNYACGLVHDYCAACNGHGTDHHDEGCPCDTSLEARLDRALARIEALEASLAALNTEETTP